MATGVPSKRGVQGGSYTLSYSGKTPEQEVLRLAANPGQRIDCGDLIDRLYWGENLGVLLHLVQEGSIRGHVRCIYIDPPYATAMSFVDREVNHAYDDTLAGSSYLEFLRQRLIVLRELLAPNGTIFLHLDQKMIFEGKIIMDEVFGAENFRSFITRKKCNTKNYTRHTFGNISDHILFYSRSEDYVWHRPYAPWTEERIKEEYPFIDKGTGRRYKRVPLHAPGIRRGETGKPWRGKLPPPGKHWQYPPSKLEEFDRLEEIYWSPNGNPRRKVFFDPSKGIPVQDIWMHFKDAHNQNIKITGYPTEKNFDMVKMIVRATTNPGDWVLDCFCGSGTTLEAARDLGRHFIGVDESRAAIDATLNRLNAGRRVMGDFVGKRGRPKTAVVGASLFD